MENMPGPTPAEEAAAVLADAETSRAELTDGLALPSLFYGSLGVAIAGQIATTAVGIALQSIWALLAIAAALVLFGLVAGIQLARFRRLNGVWIARFATRAVFGNDTATSTCYSLALAASIWAAFSGAWWLVAVSSIAGGLAYALCVRRWWFNYQEDPAPYGRAESTVWLAVIGVLVLVGLVLLVAGH
jgi:hypothetical protein